MLANNFFFVVAALVVGIACQQSIVLFIFIFLFSAHDVDTVLAVEALTIDVIVEISMHAESYLIAQTNSNIMVHLWRSRIL